MFLTETQPVGLGTSLQPARPRVGGGRRDVFEYQAKGGAARGTILVGVSEAD